MFAATARTTASRFAARGATNAASISALRSAQVQPAFVRSLATFIDAGEVSDRIVAVVKNFDKVEPSKVSPTCKFADDLGLDSLDAVEVVMAIEDEFAIEIPDAEVDKIASVSDAIEYISAHPMAK